MQLIEVSVTGVRSAAITLRSPDAAMRIVLFPITHLGTPEYYRSVEARLAECDLIVAEGIGGRSAGVRSLTLAYRLPALNRHLKLGVQDIDYSRLDVPVVNPDMTGREFGTGWKSVPLAQRLLVACLTPWAALSLALLGTRRTIGRYLAVDDLPTSLTEQVRDKLPDLTRLVLDERDQLLTDCLESVLATRQHEDIDVAVVYGAQHMPAVVRELSRRHGYRPRTADWITVLDF
ncbi:MAG TPA: hypothetical protein VGG75_03765 [Trebonia sp.]